MASADREVIKELAKRSGMSMSDYVTACCLGKQVVIIDGLKDIAKYHMELIGDVPTLQEMLVFIKNAAGRPEAEVGQHDDLVMSLAISHYIRGQPGFVFQGKHPG